MEGQVPNHYERGWHAFSHEGRHFEKGNKAYKDGLAVHENSRLFLELIALINHMIFQI
jgi:hypothetical protein